jgi:glutathione synthase/RimK-type ligase-like ATP-grasp enzyme
MVASALDDMGVQYLLFNQRRYADAHLDFNVQDGQISGRLNLQGKEFPLDAFSGVYNRMIDDRSLPEIRDLPADHNDRLQCRRLHDALLQWIEITPVRVINRMAAMASNSSKPFQMQLIRKHGFATPETLITNDPELARQFYHQHGQVIYKSASGVRSIVASFKPEDFARLERIRWCPIQFQVQMMGDNLRVHVIGEQVYATKIQTGAVDYRYAGRQGSSAELEAVELDLELARRCVRMVRSMGLAFAGIDLMLTDEDIYCFEVNPNPGFSYYENITGQPIARAVAEYLTGYMA